MKSPLIMDTQHVSVCSFRFLLNYFLTYFLAFTFSRWWNQIYISKYTTNCLYLIM